MEMRKRNKRLILLLVLSIFLLLFSASVLAKMYYEDECIIFIRSDRITYFSIIDGEVIGGYVIEIGMFNVVGIKKGVLHSYYDGEAGDNKTEIQTVIIIRDFIPDIVRVMIFGKSKMINIPVYFVSSAEDTEENL